LRGAGWRRRKPPLSAYATLLGLGQRVRIVGRVAIAVGAQEAQRFGEANRFGAAGVAAARRNVFLDDEQNVAAIRKQFALALHDAREKGSAVAIGHPHPETLQILNEMLPEAERQGVRLVFASDLAR